MVDDRNKTEITKDVTAAAAFWLEKHGFKPIETEVHVADAWVADLAAVLVPTRTELVALKLLKRHPHYLSPAYETWDAHASELTRRMTCIVEVKTTLADFRSDQNHKWSTKPPSALAFLAVPAGLIQPDQWPSGWGILECSGGKTRYARPPEIHKTDLEADIEIVCAIATRRDHFTRYQRSRDLQRKERITIGEKKMVQRFDQIARAAVSILYGQYENVESALSANGIKLAKLTARTITQFQQLWNLRTIPVEDEEIAFQDWWKVAGHHTTHPESLPPNKYKIDDNYHSRREIARVAYIGAYREHNAIARQYKAHSIRSGDANDQAQQLQ